MGCIKKNKPGKKRKPSKNKVAFLNFLYEFKHRHSDWPSARISIEAARRWCSMSDCEKKKYASKKERVQKGDKPPLKRGRRRIRKRKPRRKLKKKKPSPTSSGSDTDAMSVSGESTGGDMNTTHVDTASIAESLCTDAASTLINVASF